MDFENLKELKREFLNGTFKFPENIKVSDIPYHLRSSTNHSIQDMIEKNYKGAIIYQTADSHKEEEKAAGLNQWILLLWTFTPKYHMVPYDVRSLSRYRAGGKNITEQDEKQRDNVIGSTVEVRFTSLSGSKGIKGKVDTGATICSLHADDYNINREAGTISFKCPQLSQNELTIPLVDQQAVKSADGGSEYRPVVELNIKINGKALQGVKFNINDRSHMEYPILVGRNALEQGKFMIDTRMDEDIDWDALQQELQLNDVIIEDTDVEDVYNMLKESNVTFSDIVNFIKNESDE